MKTGRSCRNVIAGGALLLMGVGVGHFVTRSVAAVNDGSEALVTKAARSLGVKRCLPAISAIGQRAIAGATLQDIMLDWDRRSPDSAPFFTFTGLGAGNRRAAFTLVAIPRSANGCSVLVERIFASEVNCRIFAETDLKGFPGTDLIDGIKIHQNPVHPEETYALIDNNDGCLIIRRQTALQWPPSG